MSDVLRRTKIVATLGPATDRDNNLEKIIKAGANVVRLNFSHGAAADHIARAQRVRDVAQRLGRQVAILGDLQGPKIRVSTFKEGKALLTAGEPFILDAWLEKGLGDNQRVGIDYKALPEDVLPGDILLLDDGRIQLRVVSIAGAAIHTVVTVGGVLSNNKGVNKLGGGLSAEALTEKDKADIVTAAAMNVDYLAVSFPRNGEDLRYARRLAQEAGCRALIVAKVERAEVVATQESMDDMILASDVIMVARGDLGVEIGDAALVAVQKRLIARSRQLNRVVITATQMMESMITNPLPTRAEVMDVANAVLDGTDAVMLSAETAAGSFPAEAVAAMHGVCLGAERVPSVTVSKHRLEVQFDNIEEMTAMSAMYAANHLTGVKAVIAMTESGRTARMMSRITSRLPIFALSRHQSTLNLTTLYRGVTPVLFNGHAEGVQSAQDAIAVLREAGYLSSGDLVVLSQGDSVGLIGSANTCRICIVD
ncbi:pyruvate kinase [bacteria symbiont BFo1 of Frankliniella occidentalis]|uniref:pyruvate kinase n=1 Tax=Erwinia aphidicola TaxID=68334 RepID=UPI0006645436|nr:pyruvate kinase [Erwinia aphidicola]KMV67688.1 pyruvate kinase [bacteria symbiont BFo1 of Frankliniella occidentalis]PIJ60304.1 pyruvate kinase [Erwinia sp. OLMDLW33]KYP85396.1 pyruvate kinase [bacteria symbiont BFo1 of Frankliniella occidentalis]KYP90666.1 pyruvate kinase [bacteria symbiont BFo1 of Frankliniella occidentalis]MBD1375473.1 pyruvate kinase [Erwinia aphidicola]